MSVFKHQRFIIQGRDGILGLHLCLLMPLPLLKKILPPALRLSLRMLYWQARGLVYRGSIRYCPLCQSSFRTFLPFGKPARAQAMCPKCNTVERHRLLWFYLQDQLQIESRQLKVLHMAPEPIIQQKLKQLPNLDYLSADLISPAAMQHVDLQALPFANGSFDLILCSHVLGHVPDDRQALRELCRVLRPNGILLLQDHVNRQLPQTQELPDSLTAQQRDALYGQPDRCRNYGVDFEARMQQQGFTLEVIDYTPSFPEKELLRMSLTYRERMYLASPKPY